MSDEPKTLTPAEALRRLREEGMELTFDSNDATPWAVYRERGGTLPEFLHFGQAQEEVLSAALGVPVVARDEAAELRAENAQLKADLREYVEDGFLQGAHRQEDGGYSTSGISTYRDLGDWLVEHAGWTQREGGVGRMQVYDPPRRLAGGENEK